MTPISPIHVLDCPYGLVVLAHTYTSPAQDALGQIPNNEGIDFFHRPPSPDRVEFGITDPVVLCQGTENALVTLAANNAGRRMIREDQLQNSTPGPEDRGRISYNLHALGYGRDAGGQEPAGLCIFHKAYATCSCALKNRMMAKRGYLDPHLPGQIQDRGIWRPCNFPTVKGNSYGLHG
jgi:hypothetical protein